VGGSTVECVQSWPAGSHARGEFPLWRGDADSAFYIAAPDGAQALFVARADGTDGPRTPLRQPARAPESWSTANAGLTFITLIDDDYDVWFHSMADSSNMPVAVRPGSAQYGSQFSPDGRWIAYESNETGEFEIYVTAFPPAGTPRQVTRGGGRRPMWSADGRELFFDDGHRLSVTAVSNQPTLSFDTPKTLPITGFVQGDARRQYDLVPDGRFLMLVYGSNDVR